jgi:hypothetical protein
MAMAPTSSKGRGRMPSDDASRETPPFGFEIFRADELDPIAGRPDRWGYIGIVSRRSVIRSGFSSWAAACRAAWAAASGAATIRPDVEPPAYVEPERYKPREAKPPPTMRDTYTIKFGTWDAMAADLLSQIIHDAGSLRRAAKAIALPRSTFSLRVRDYIARGIWPAVK